jgi:hypothetical protein
MLSISVLEGFWSKVIKFIQIKIKPNTFFLPGSLKFNSTNSSEEAGVFQPLRYVVWDGNAVALGVIYVFYFSKAKQA